MKKLIYTFVFVFCFAFVSKAQYVNIPDSNFGKFLIQQYPTCLYKDVNNLYWMDTTCGAVVNESTLDCRNKNISSIEGAKYFKNLIYLHAENNNIDSLPRLPQSLTTVFIQKNKIAKLDLETLNLGYLDASYNNITSVNNLNVSTHLYLNNNKNLQCLSWISNNIYTLYIDSTLIHCLPNKLPKLNKALPAYTMPLCSNTNNPNNCISITSKINLFNIPDTNFGKALIGSYAFGVNLDDSNKYWMDTTYYGIVNRLNFDFRYLLPPNTYSLEGLQFFKNLDELWLSSISITALPNISNSITRLALNYMDNLYKIDKLPTNLRTFNFYSVPLRELPILPNNLKELSSYWTGLYQPPGWDYDVQVKPSHLKTLPNLPSGLQLVAIYSDSLTNLPNLPNSLLELFIKSPLFENLPENLPDSLFSIGLYTSPVKCLPSFKNKGRVIRLNKDSTQMKCITNSNCTLINTSSSQNEIFTIPICNPTNNPNQCHIYPSISGNVFTDNNSNSTKDTNEYYRPFVKLSLNNGQTTYTNLNGNYNITLDTLGSYTLKITPPPFYKAVPDSVNITVTQGNPQIILPDIALQPITVIDSFIVKHVSLNRPRPGFNYALSVGYANMGTVNSTQNNIVSLLFDSSLLHFDSAGLPVQSLSYSSNFGLASFNAGSLVAGQWNIFNTYFTVKPTAPIGDSIFTIAAITYGNTKAMSKDSARIVGSYDPNDKQATPQLSIQQVQNGEYIDYVIHFQNLGTDSAVNIVIADTLSNLLSYSYLQVVGSSHNANLSYSIGNGILYFEFLNIKLPPASVNEPLSHGYIHFRIKALPSLAVGAIIPNKASIYFDYNLPVVTNTATTSIESIITPVRIINYTINAVTENNSIAGIQNKWITGTEVNVSHYTIERSLNGKEFMPVGEVPAQGLTNYSFTDKLSNNYSTVIFYRLKVVDKDGKYFYTSVQSIELKANNNNGLSIYPNPSKGAFTIATQLVKQVIIIDVLGKTVVEKTFNGQQTNFTYQLNKGIYWVKCMMQNGEMKTEKLVIE